MVASLDKLALNSTIASDARVLTLDVVDVVSEWVQQGIELAKQDEGEMDVDEDSAEGSPKRLKAERGASTAPSVANGGAGMTYGVPPSLRDQARNNLVDRALALLRELIGASVRDESNIKLPFFQRSFAGDVSDETLSQLCNSVEVVSSYKPAGWHLQNVAVLRGHVEKGFSRGELRLTSSPRPFTERLLDHLPRNVGAYSADASTPGKPHIERARTTTGEELGQMTDLPAIIRLLQAWNRVEPERVGIFVPTRIRVFTRYIEKHVASATVISSVDANLRLLVSILDVLRIVPLVEESSNIDVCRFLLQMVRKWVFDKDEQFPTLKEKAGILSTMISFESRTSEASHENFLNLILNVYTDTPLARSELALPPRADLLIGLRSTCPSARSTPISRSSPGASLAIAKNPPAAFVTQLEAYNTGELLELLGVVYLGDPLATHTIRASTCETAWMCLTRIEQRLLAEFVVSMLVKDYHLRSLVRKPNVIQTLLHSATACTPTLVPTPLAIRYHARPINSWYTGIELLQETPTDARKSDSVRETAIDALSELYAELSEDDLLYGLWRRRAAYNETNAATSWEHPGQRGRARVLHESAQMTARGSSMPFSESSLSLWENHWIVTAQKLQQSVSSQRWDMLSAMVENKARRSSCSIDKPGHHAPPPHLRDAAALLAAYSANTPEDATAAKKTFAKLCGEGVQLSLRKWYYLPETVTQAHYREDQHTFQQFVELQETQQMFSSLARANAANLDARRLPSLRDDIDLWSDLIARRQHRDASSFAYRGFHETTSISNRFTHVAHRHNFERGPQHVARRGLHAAELRIQEAFLELRK
ncbi:hypothetical protein BMF94_0993 [Rhodotorula taiwanensis]|uniref:PIK-related kinase FAT domain-containing protein n=1 Tax=Rhodotorula taiwanensis TaxID=741276 RepID=A0A2S5BGK9_9BASI|nr:hypothetical protein BMF94_0993 [Rhodotorula taiwanensis]